MAESRAKKPRIRKTAPTKREQVEAAKAAPAQKPAKQRVARAIVSPFKKIKIPSNPLTRALAKVFHPVGRVLRWLVPKYFVNSWREVRQVAWPNRRETWRLTGAVFVFAIVFGALVSGVDKVLDAIFKNVVLK